MSEEEATTKGEQTQADGDKTVQRIERVVLSESEKGSLSKDEWAQKWLAMESYVDQLEDRIATMEAEMTNLKAAEERYKQQNGESLQRERILIRRLTNKDQEIQDYMNQIAELKANQAPGAAALRSALLDPAVNLLLHRLRQEITTLKTRLEETQNELSAWKFTPDSNTGKRLMAKCRLLHQENEELGKMVSSGRIAKLEGDLALQKSFSEEVKKSQSELDEFLQDLDEDVEGMQSTIYFLQQELRKTKEALTELQREKSSSPSSANPDNVNKGDDSEFRTGDRLTNGSLNSSVMCGSRTSTNQSDKVKEYLKTDQTNNNNKRTNHGETSSEILKCEKRELLEENDNEVNGERKRTFDESSSESDNLPLVKKGRRGSELSLDYNEDELCLTNGESKPENR